MHRKPRAISRHRQRTLPLSAWRYRACPAPCSADDEELALREKQRARRRAAMLNWVYRQMRVRLTARERHCVVLHYLREMSYSEVAAATGTDRSSACRAVLRGIRKLQLAAEEDAAWRG